MKKSFPLYGSNSTRPVKVDGVYPLTLGATVIGALLLTSIWGPMLFITTPIIFILALRMMRGRRATAVTEEVVARARADLLQALGRTLVHADFGAVASTRRPGVVASGLAYDGQHLYAIEESVAEPVAWADIRRFSWRIETDQTTHVQIDVHTPNATPMPDFGAAQAAQARRTALAMQRSGFFLDVADIERPVRHFVTSDKKILLKWYEILTQMKEGRLTVL